MTGEKSFEEYGFLSDIGRRNRASDDAKYQPAYDRVMSRVRQSMAQVRALEGRRLAVEGVDQGVAYWLRSLEASQAAVILADQGMPGVAESTVRLALECLFYAAACWKAPTESLAKISADFIKSWSSWPAQMPEEMMAQFEADEQLSLKKVATMKGDAASVAKIAELADLEFLYNAQYRLLSKVGAHASVVSVARHLQVADSQVELIFQPDFSCAPGVWDQVEIVLEQGMKRFDRDLMTKLDLPPSPG